MDTTVAAKAHLEAFGLHQVDAFKYAVESRRQEIDLYWRRASYFWTLSAAAFAGFFALQGAEHAHPAARLSVSCIGLVFSFAWVLASRGAKYWQAHWEAQVEILEDAVVGPLFKTNLASSASKWNLLAPFPFSVTTINQLLSVFLTLTWCLFVFWSIHDAGLGFRGSISPSSAILVLSALFIILLFWKGQSSIELVRKITMTRRRYE